MEKQETLQVERADEDEASETTDGMEEPTQEVTPEPAQGKPKSEKAVEPQKEEEGNMEHWFSKTDPKHMLMIPVETESGDKHSVIEFDKYVFDLDLDNKKDEKISEALHAHDRNGIDIFVVGKTYKDHQYGTKEKALMMKRLREYGDDLDGINRLAALFTRKEMVDNSINPSFPDKDAMICLALETKTLGDM